MRSALVLLALTSVLTARLGAQQFERDAGALPAGGPWSDGVELADVDGDGDVDILFANGSSYGGGGQEAQHLFVNDGAGNFTAAHAQLNMGTTNAKMVIAEDFDGDGDLDLMYAVEGPFPATTQFPRMLVNQGGAQAGTQGVFADESPARLPAISMASFCVCAGDVDDDGDLDVVFTDGATFFGVATQARLYLNDGDGFFSDATSTNMPVDTYNAQDVTLFDYDGDYDIDIALSGKGAAGKRARLYLNDGTGVFTVSSALNALGTGDTYEIDWGDLDGDGDFDAAVQSISSIKEGWGENVGPTTAASQSTFPNPNSDDDNEMGLLDYDDDGDLDVFVASLASSEKIYRNDGGGSFVNASGNIESQSDASLDIGFADLNGDGAYDVVTAQGEAGSFTNKVYLNGGPVDSLAPVLLGAELPAGLGVPATVFHARIQDAIHDDGHINAGMTYAYTTNVGSGSGTATHMGGGLFRAEVPAMAGLNSIDLDWTATDAVGNAATYATVSLTGPWTYVGDGTQGVTGMPTLEGRGPLTGASVTKLDLKNAAPGQTAALFFSLQSNAVPFKHGLLYPFPLGKIFFLTTNAKGQRPLTTVWSTGLPAGITTYWQYAIVDTSVPLAGVALSNGMLGTTP